MRRLLLISILLLLLTTGVAAAADFGYVTNTNSNTVSVIDLNSNTVSTNITVGTQPIGVATNPGGTRIYVSNSMDHTISVIDPGTNTVIHTISLGWSGPRTIVMNGDGTKLYVACTNSQDVKVIDTTTNQVVTSIGLGTSPRGIAMQPNGQYLYAACYYTNQVKIIRISDNTVVKTLSVGAGPDEIAFNPLLNSAYVVNSGANTVSKIGTSSQTVDATITVGSNPSGVTFIPSGSEAYVTYGSNQVAVITTANDQVSRNIVVGNSPCHVKATGGKVYVVNCAGTSVSVIRMSDYTVISTITVGNAPEEMAFGDIGEESAVVGQKVVQFYLHTYYFQRWSEFTVTAYDADWKFIDSAISDSNGLTSFVMVPGKQYRINVYSSSMSVNKTETFTPDNTANQLVGITVVPLTSWGSTFNPGNVSTINTSQQYNGYGTGFSDRDIHVDVDTRRSGTTGYIDVFYTDDSQLTQQVTFTLLENLTDGSSTISTVTQPTTNARYANHTFVIPEANGHSYTVKVQAVNNYYGVVTRVHPATFPHKAVLQGIDEGFYPMIVLIVVILTAAASFMLVNGLVALIIVGEAYWFYGIGWLDTVTGIGVGLSGAVVAAFLYYGGRKERGEE
ncbi:hypothetical protein [Methanocella sp. MCL-LM]|uniref:hypothetical protein n=1 Tax=Methanocella sp. MCL-LM TaxID=3412035 RepID=UPI003C747832